MHEESRVHRALQMHLFRLLGLMEGQVSGMDLGGCPMKKIWVVLEEAVVVQGQGLSLQSLLQTCTLVTSIVLRMGYKSPNHFYVSIVLC